MEEKTLNENEQKIINNVKDENLKRQLIEGFQNGKYMTTEEFCQRLEALKTSLIKKHQMRYDNSNSQ